MKSPTRFIVALAAVTAFLAALGTLLLTSVPPALAAGAGAGGGGLGPEAATLGVLAAALSTAQAPCLDVPESACEQGYFTVVRSQ